MAESRTLHGKVAVITGCAGGLGKQHALRFAHEGAKLAICDILKEPLMETKQRCEENPCGTRRGWFRRPCRG
jgi:NAD(P)-dependent dehydrogenase (short-subunit alcohol dehydrogenase family)